MVAATERGTDGNTVCTDTGDDCTDAGVSGMGTDGVEIGTDTGVDGTSSSTLDSTSNEEDAD